MVLEQLLALRHSNGQPVVRIYGPITTERRGGTIACDVCDPSGALFIDDRKQGALRVSVGLVTNFSDIYRFLQFVQTMIDRPALASARRM